jgi:hypothetical protein
VNHSPIAPRPSGPIAKPEPFPCWMAATALPRLPSKQLS